MSFVYDTSDLVNSVGKNSAWKAVLISRLSGIAEAMPLIRIVSVPQLKRIVSVCPRIVGVELFC